MTAFEKFDKLVSDKLTDAFYGNVSDYGTCTIDYEYDSDLNGCRMTVSEHDHTDHVLFRSYFTRDEIEHQSMFDLMMKLLTTPVLLDIDDDRACISVATIWTTADHGIRVVPMTTWVNRDTLDWAYVDSDAYDGNEDRNVYINKKSQSQYLWNAFSAAC